MSDVETAVQYERAVASQGKIPTGLSFDELVKNQTLSPFSLNDYMDYLFYVEQSAEPLQFFLWYCDYIQRWSNLLPRQKALSPIWDPENGAEPRSRYITYSHKRARSEKMNKIISIMEMMNKNEKNTANGDATTPHGRSMSAVSGGSRGSRGRAYSGSSTMSATDCKEDLQPFTVQPFRDEVSRVAKHYIAESGARKLNLAPKDRERCLHAVQHTTHPSALLPAFVVAEANLKGQSHPNFVRWSRANVNKPRIIFLRFVGVMLIVLGITVDLVFIMSRLNHYLRILCITLLWPGLTVTIAAFQGVCMLLHFRNVRHLRPWEQFGDLEHSDGDGKDDDLSSSDRKSMESSYRTHARKDTNSSSFSRVDPLRKSSLQTFGPKNDPSREPWVKRYAAKSLYQKIFEVTTPVQNQTLQLLLDRTIFFAIIWGGLVSSVLTVASLFVPSGDMFL